jgi:hypothetical protein
VIAIVDTNCDPELIDYVIRATTTPSGPSGWWPRASPMRTWPAPPPHQILGRRQGRRAGLGDARHEGAAAAGAVSAPNA